MPDSKTNPGEPIPGEPSPDARRWSQVWQLPSVLLGTGLFTMAVFFMLPSTPEDDFNGALESVSMSILALDLTSADEALRDLKQSIQERGDEAVKAWYDELWGDLVYFQQGAHAGGGASVNHEMILTYYRDAIEQGRKLDAVHRQRMIDSLIALGLESDAIRMLESFTDQEAKRRHAVLRQIIDRRLLSVDVDIEALQSTINRYLDELASEPDNTTRRRGNIWATALKARLLFDVGDAQETIKLVERKLIIFFDQGGNADTGPLYVLRGKAYQRLGDFDLARESYVIAQKVLPAGNAQHADVLVGLGQIELVQSNDVRLALQHFKIAEQQYRPLVGDPVHSPYMDALIGRAECEARLGKHVGAIDLLKSAVHLMSQSRRPPQDKWDRLVNTAMSHHMATSDVDEYETAMQYLAVLTPLYKNDKDGIPAELLAQFAATHEHIAVMKLKNAGLSVPGQTPALGGGSPSQEDVTPAIKEASPAAARLIRQDAASHYDRAGDFYRDHANATCRP